MTVFWNFIEMNKKYTPRMPRKMPRRRFPFSTVYYIIHPSFGGNVGTLMSMNLCFLLHLLTISRRSILTLSKFKSSRVHTFTRSPSMVASSASISPDWKQKYARASQGFRDHVSIAIEHNFISCESFFTVYFRRSYRHTYASASLTPFIWQS